MEKEGIKMVKVDLITGFLGSGKTTFIQRYARYLMGKGEKIGIIENDYGSVNVDMMLLQELEREGASTEMVIASDLDCYRRRFRTKLITMGMEGLSQVIVEPSGIYDVDEFFDALYEEPQSRLLEPGTVISVVDAGLDIPLGRSADYLLTSQLSDSGIVLLSHMGDDPGMKEKAAGTIRYINQVVGKFGCRRRFSEQYSEEKGGFGEDILAKDWDSFTEADFEKIRNAGYQQYDHAKLQVESKSGFSSLYYMNLELGRQELSEAVADLMKDHRNSQRIFRVKGFFREAGSWYELNATHSGIRISKVQEGQDVLIVIGESVDPETVDAKLHAKHI